MRFQFSTFAARPIRPHLLQRCLHRCRRHQPFLSPEPGNGLARKTAPGAYRANCSDPRSTRERRMKSIPRPPEGRQDPCSDPGWQSVRDARSGFEAVSGYQALLQKFAGVAEVWSGSVFLQDPCWIVICSSSAPCRDINPLIISGPIPKARSTRRTSPLMPG